VLLVGLVVWFVYVALTPYFSRFGGAGPTGILATGLLSILALSVFLVQLLQTTARYHLRVADRLDDLADVLQLFPTASPREFAVAIGAFASISIAFGKMPALSDRVLERLGQTGREDRGDA
jgi:hypothetical protein